MCAQTRPRFILSSERVFGGMEFEPMLTPREKSPLPENFPRGGSNPQRCGQRAQTLPMSYSGPYLFSNRMGTFFPFHSISVPLSCTLLSFSLSLKFNLSHPVHTRSLCVCVSLFLSLSFSFSLSLSLSLSLSSLSLSFSLSLS